MTYPTFDGRKAAPAFLALAAVGFIASAPAHAADPAPAVSEDDDASGQRENIIVTGQEVKSEQESPKATRTVRDTPQTVTIITNKVIEEQNLLTLRDVLSTVPGITFGAAEGGIAPSDQITLRGFSASSDITTDGVRDSAQYSRSDPFNLEQVEVVNGANSVYNGSGSVGGSINIVTKRPQEVTQVAVQGGIGTDDYYRGTIDANVRASELIAFRLNAMIHKADVPGRDVENYDRWGVAPALTIGIGGPTSLTLQYLHQEEENVPQYGVPYFKNAFLNGIVPGVDRSDYFGYRNVDTQDITIDQATAIFSHDLSDTVSIRNLTRWQKVSQLTIVGPPQGTYCLASGVTQTGAACTATINGAAVTLPSGYYLISGPRGNVRDVTNELMYDQVDLSAKFATGAIEHTLVLGASAGWEKFTLTGGNVFRNADTTLAYSPYPLVNIANPNTVVPGPAGFDYGSNVYTGPINFVQSSWARGEVSNYAVYLFDTMKLGKFELNGGIRYERNEGNFQSASVPRAESATTTRPQGAIVVTPRFSNRANLFSYRIGLVYKPVEAVSLYAAYGNSRTPSQTAVNGGCDAESCNVAPESAKNYEIGAKAELFGGRLLLSAAAFRNERDSYRVPSGDPTLPDDVLEGHSRVDGVALSASGNITPAWSVTANYTYLEPKLIRSVAIGLPDPAAGAQLQNTPNHSGSLYTTYTLPFGLKLGYGVTYQGSFALNLPSATNTRIFRSDDYWVHNASVSYDFNTNFTVQVNVKNFTDALYYTRIRNNGGWAAPGDARQAVLTVGYRF